MFADKIFIKLIENDPAKKDELLSIKQLLLENWFDSENIFRSISENNLEKLGIDKESQILLLSAIKTACEENKAVINMNNSRKSWNDSRSSSVPKNNQNNKKQDEFSVKNELKKFQNYEKDVSQRISSVDLLEKILKNISANPNEKKYRTLKRSNKLLYKNIFSYISLQKILFHLGFKDKDLDNFEMHDSDYNGELIKQCLECLEEFVNQTSSEMNFFENNKKNDISEEKKVKIIEDLTIELSKIRENIKKAALILANNDIKIVKGNKTHTLFSKITQIEIDSAKKVIEEEKNRIREMNIEFLEIIEKNTDFELILSKTKKYLNIEKCSIKFSVVVANREIITSFPVWFKLKKVYQKVQHWFNPKFQNFYFKLPSIKKPINLDSSSMKMNLMTLGCFPDSVIRIILDESVISAKEQILAKNFDFN